MFTATSTEWHCNKARFRDGILCDTVSATGRWRRTESTSLRSTILETSPFTNLPRERLAKFSGPTKTCRTVCQFHPMGDACCIRKSTKPVPISCSSIISVKGSPAPRDLRCRARVGSYSHAWSFFLFAFPFDLGQFIVQSFTHFRLHRVA